MKRTLFLLATLLLINTVFAEKRSLSLKSLTWYLMEKNEASIDDFNKQTANISETSIDNLLLNTGKTVYLQAIIEAPANDGSKYFFEVNEAIKMSGVFVNGKKLNNLRSDQLFTAEIINESENSELLLSIELDSSLTHSASVLEYLSNMQLSYINGLTIAWAEPLEDPFFGGYMLEVHIWNLLTDDIDGKLKAHITNPETFELIAENNNCAFSRNGMESIIDINFPEAKEKLTKGKFVAEIMLVDKEKNEEEVDKEFFPIVLK